MKWPGIRKKHTGTSGRGSSKNHGTRRTAQSDRPYAGTSGRGSSKNHGTRRTAQSDRPYAGTSGRGISKNHGTRRTAQSDRPYAGTSGRGISKNHGTRRTAQSDRPYAGTSGRGSSKDVWLGTTSGSEFETVCANVLSGCGLRVKKLGGAADGGRDLIVWHNYKKIVVECKHQAKLIGRPVVQKLHSAFIAEKAAAGMVISTSGFSAEAEAYEFSEPKTADVLGAIRHVRGRIILVDLAGLQKLADAAGIRVHEADDPSTRDIDAEQALGAFEGIKSRPASILDVASMSVEGHHTDTYWVADVSVKQTFRNSANKVVYNMNKSKTYACRPDGAVLGGKLAKFVLKGGDDLPKARSAFQRSAVVAEARRSFTTKASYKGGNGSSYTKTCVPSTDKISTRARPVGVRRTAIAIRLFRTTYKLNIPDWDCRLNCRLCGEPKSILRGLLLCNECGKVAHGRSCGGECRDCKKTICDRCGLVQKGLLKTSRLCPGHAAR